MAAGGRDRYAIGTLDETFSSMMPYVRYCSAVSCPHSDPVGWKMRIPPLRSAVQMGS